jgi:hypothetical protein
MGRRSRKRGVRAAPAPTTVAPRAAAAAPVSRRARMEEAPKAAWSPFPLTELVILVALVLLLVGFITKAGVTVAVGVVLASLAGGELAVREHFAGFRSHSTLLALLAGFLVAGVAYVIGAPQGAVLAIAIAVAVATFPYLRKAFMRRAGGLGFRA